MSDFALFGVIAAVTTVLSIGIYIALLVLAILALIAQWRIHKLLGCRWPWYIFIQGIHRIQILELMKDDSDTIEVAGKNIPYHLLGFYEAVGAVASVLLSVLAFIPILGALVIVAANIAITGFIGRYYNARVIALLYGESPDDYEPFLKQGFFWSIFPFLPFFWLRKNV